MATVYAMITSRNSDYYTRPAIDSFFKNTRLDRGDKFVLIDNDAVGGYDDSRVVVVTNTEPQSFSKNINNIIDLADGADVVVLNNDIEFTPGWAEPLKGYANSILIPSCNQTHVYASGDGSLTLAPSMTLEEYDNNQYGLSDIVRQHRGLVKGFFESVLMPFYAFRLPAAIYTKVGKFDESYPKAGGEDIDYRLRAIQAGFSVKYASQSYLLHFHGKSTWAGGEQAEQTRARNQTYWRIFANTWGTDLANALLVGGDIESVLNKYQLWDYVQRNDITGLIKRLLWIREGNSIVPMNQVSANGLEPYLKKLGTDLVGCELGVCLGYTLRYFFDQNVPIKRVYAVDAWEPYMDHWGQVTQEMVDRWEAGARSLLSPYQDRIEILKMDSLAAADQIAEGELDYIFIDGDHSYGAVSRDLRAWWSKVRVGGVFAGHDWNLPEVYQAVTDFRSEYGITTEIQFCEKNVWFWDKEVV